MGRLRVLGVLVVMLSLGVSHSHSAENKTKKEAVVLMPLRATKDIPQDEMTQYEAALVKSLSEKYVVYSGQRVLAKVEEVYKKRSSEAKAGKECDETKCVQDVAIAFQTELVAIANIRKSGGGYSISLSINDVIEDKSVFSESVPCKGCDEFEVIRQLKTLAGGTTPQTPVADKQAAPKSGNSEDKENIFWNSIKDSANPGDFEAYLESFPKGTFVPLAKSKITSLKKSSSQVQVESRSSAQPAPVQQTPVAKTAPEGMVYVNKPGGGFYMDKYLVTQDGYERVIGSNPSNFKGCPTCPVEQVTWFEADAYCKKVGKKLPTEQDWEYAATSEDKDEPWAWAGTSNESELGEYAWYDKNSDRKTHPVGQKRPNGLGLYDMSGNVDEWTDSWYNSSNEYRVVRGGSWAGIAAFLRASHRRPSAPDSRLGDIGFRCSQY